MYAACSIFKFLELRARQGLLPLETLKLKEQQDGKVVKKSHIVRTEAVS